MEFKGQVALVTGAGRGIGKAIALGFARGGADVAVFEIDAAAAESTAREVEGCGVRSFRAAVDVTDYQQVQAATAAAAQALGKVDILVNNAGIANTARFLEIGKASWDSVIAVHLSGSFHCAQAAAREMVKHNYGRIVSIASIAGLMGPPDAVHYSAAKAGIIGLTRAMALDLADFGITANAIAPGPVDTELLRSVWTQGGFEERADHVPVRRLGGVEEIARAVLFLASPSSSYISGVVLPVDGGSVAAGSYMVEKYRRRRLERKS
jgi:NAD(P)-dependent dehydrogenase (short-subunit alcohol dehydrogenase family)